MVHKKYTYKNGKRYGPYYYHNKRVGGKVITTYIGMNHPERGKKFFGNALKILGLVLLIFIGLFFVGEPLFSPDEVETLVVDFDKQSYLGGSLVSGKVLLSLREGELIPADSVLRVEYGGSVFDRELIGEVSEGDFYLSGAEIVGRGEGIGVVGMREVFPEVSFDLVVGDEGDGTGSVPPTHPDSVEEEIIGEGGDVEEEVIEGGEEVVGEEGVDGEGEIDSTEIPAGGSGDEGVEASDGGESEGGEDGSVPPTHPDSVEEEVSGEGSEESGSGSSEGSGDDSGSEVGGSDGAESSGSSGDSGGSDSGEGGGGEVALSPISGVVSKGNDFVYSLEEGEEEVEIVSGSVKVDGVEVDSSVLDLEVVGGEVIVSTEYSVIEEGFGEGFLGEVALEIEFDLGEFGFVAGEGGILDVGVVFEEEEIVGVSEEVVVGEVVEENVTEEEIVVNETDVIVNETVGEEEVVNVSGGYGAILGQPVKWVKRVNVRAGEKSVKVEVPASSEKIEVRKIGEDGGSVPPARPDSVEAEISGEDEGSEESGSGEEGGSDVNGSLITGAVVSEVSSDEVVVSDIGEDVKEVEVVVDSNVTDVVEVEYETPAPYAVERVTAQGKEVKIVGPDVRYENVLAFTELPESFDVKSSDGVRIYWEEEERYVEPLNVRDRDGNGLYDYIEWVVPHLSNQTFRIIVIIKAEHLNSSRDFISDIYEEVKEQDGIWSEVIPDGDYVRVTFERKLDSTRDITVYPKVVFSCSGDETVVIGDVEVPCEIYQKKKRIDEIRRLLE